MFFVRYFPIKNGRSYQYFFLHFVLPIIDIEKSNFIFSEIEKLTSNSIYKKNKGLLFSNEHLPNFYNRDLLSDTILFKKKYKRFEINSPQNYTITMFIKPIQYFLIAFILMREELIKVGLKG